MALGNDISASKEEIERWAMEYRAESHDLEELGDDEAAKKALCTAVILESFFPEEEEMSVVPADKDLFATFLLAWAAWNFFSTLDNMKLVMWISLKDTFAWKGRKRIPRFIVSSTFLREVLLSSILQPVGSTICSGRPSSIPLRINTSKL